MFFEHLHHLVRPTNFKGFCPVSFMRLVGMSLDEIQIFNTVRQVKMQKLTYDIEIVPHGQVALLLIKQLHGVHIASVYDTTPLQYLHSTIQLAAKLLKLSELKDLIADHT